MSDFHPFLRIPGRDSSYQVSHKSTHELIELIMFSTILTYEFVSFFFELAPLGMSPKTSARCSFGAGRNRG